MRRARGGGSEHLTHGTLVSCTEKSGIQDDGWLMTRVDVQERAMLGWQVVGWH